MALTENNSIRLNQLDKLRTLCAFLIVLIHSESPFSEYYIPITRCAVPVFLLLSGFLMSQKSATQIRRSIYTILHYVILATVVFSVVKVCISYIKGDWKWISVKSIIDFLIFNDNPVATHLWYLTAYLYVLIIVYFLVKKGINLVRLWPLIPVLLLGNLFIGNYSCFFFDTELNCNLSRNFLFIGLPYFLLGAVLKNKQPYLPSNTIAITCIVALSAITSCLEDNWLDTLTSQHIDDHFISTPILAISLFMLFYNMRNNENLISRVGRDYSLYIYLYHPLVIFIYVVLKSFGLMSENFLMCYLYIHPLVVFVLTTLGVYIFKSNK